MAVQAFVSLRADRAHEQSRLFPADEGIVRTILSYSEEETGVTTHPIGSPVAVLECRPHSSPAAALGPIERRDLAVAIVAGNRSVTELAEEHDVSRKFLYRQANTARQALERACCASAQPRAEQLFARGSSRLSPRCSAG